MSVVVVGIDGSHQSMGALLCAASEARLRHVLLRVVHAFEVPMVDARMVAGVVDAEPFERVARQLVGSALTAVGRDLEGLDVVRDFFECRHRD